jgi:hypothetical protein
MSLWMTDSSADVAEWAFRVGPARVVRTAVLLRGRRLALLAEQWEGPGDRGTMRVELPEGVDASAMPGGGSRALLLTTRRGRRAAQVFPIGLPAASYPTERGSLSREGNAIVLRQAAPAGSRRVWRALLVSWEPRRLRQTVHWRTLTVSQHSKACDPEVAFGSRITWGRDETLLIYRSLAPPAIRSCLGLQTKDRFLIGLFSKDGEVDPLVQVEA